MVPKGLSIIYIYIYICISFIFQPSPHFFAIHRCFRQGCTAFCCSCWGCSMRSRSEGSTNMLRRSASASAFSTVLYCSVLLYKDWMIDGALSYEIPGKVYPAVDP